MLDTP
ncbi:hypothetical protein D027_4498A, partial [Vibrio parahaemolyticus 861]